MIGKNLTIIINDALELCYDLRHDILTIEHIMFCASHNKEAIDLLKSLNIDVSQFRILIKNYLHEYLSPANDFDKKKIPTQTKAFGRVFENMMELNRESSLEFVDFFVSVFNEKDSFSVKILKALGVSSFEMKSTQDRPRFSTSSKRYILQNYAINISQLAKENKLDPVVYRDEEIKRVIEILNRKKKNNPILLGEAGVGKSSIVDGVAQYLNKIKSNLEIYSLDIASLLAGTKYRGDFEKRIKEILECVEKNKNIVLFIDEMHMIVGAGTTQNSSIDASNLLKPALANGKLTCIGATTFAEYKNTIEKDKALARRFAKINIKEASKEASYAIIEKLVPLYEKFHNVKYSSEAIKACVDLSDRYIHNLCLPDKAIDILDEAGSINKQPKSTAKIGVEQIEEAISRYVNIPKSKISKSQKDNLKSLQTKLSAKIFAQDEAIKSICDAIYIAGAGLRSHTKPIANLLFTGKSGVGKSELAKNLALILNIDFVSFDMSEYQESHSVSKLIGTSAGYVGYEDGGLLTNKIKKHPYCVLLLDEIEKAHSDIYNLLLQVMEYGKLTDSSGNIVDFKNVILILTSNVSANNTNNLGFNTTASTNSLKDYFSPEFRSRLDGIICFNGLKEDDYKKIINKYLKELEAMIEDKKIKIKISSTAMKFLISQTRSQELGAREIKGIVDKYILLDLSKAIIMGEITGDASICYEFKNQKITHNIKKSSTIKEA